KCHAFFNRLKRPLLFYIIKQNPLQDIYEIYNKVGYNCFIAAGIYVVVGIVSFYNVRMNKRNEYLVH
uniref:Uncharacterized protein n=1 Tax=Astyanax mexicanus TaxID=7994 RepID=A0A8B9KQX4_ASTMX